MSSCKQPIVPCAVTLGAVKTVLCTFPMEKATRYTREIASKEPNMCKKNYSAGELVRKIK